MFKHDSKNAIFKKEDVVFLLSKFHIIISIIHKLFGNLRTKSSIIVIPVFWHEMNLSETVVNQNNSVKIMLLPKKNIRVGQVVWEDTSIFFESVIFMMSSRCLPNLGWTNRIKLAPPNLELFIFKLYLISNTLCTVLHRKM